MSTFTYSPDSRWLAALTGTLLVMLPACACPAAESYWHLRYPYRDKLTNVGGVGCLIYTLTCISQQA